MLIQFRIGEPEPQKLSYRGAIAHSPANANDIPIIIVPGVFLNYEDVLLLASALHYASDGRRPIFVDVDPRNLNSAGTDFQGYKSTQQQAEQLADEIDQRLLKGTTQPCIIVGYSYGATLAGMTAPLLQDKFDTHLILIDGASPESVRKHLSQNAKPIPDLINIVNYAAKLSGLTVKINENEEVLNVLLNKTLAARLNLLKASISQMAKKHGEAVEKVDNFFKLMAIAEGHLINLLTPNLHNPCINSVSSTALVTKKSIDKFNDRWAGWKTTYTDLTLLDDSALFASDHQDLLNETNSILLANTIQSYIVGHFNIEYLQQALHRFFQQTSLQIAQSNLHSTSSASTSPTRSPQIPAIRSQVSDESSDCNTSHSRRSSGEFSSDGSPFPLLLSESPQLTPRSSLSDEETVGAANPHHRARSASTDSLSGMKNPFQTPPESLNGSPSTCTSALFNRGSASPSRTLSTTPPLPERKGAIHSF